jgi:hypothetical protein
MNTKNIIITVILVVLALGLGGAGGYYMTQMSKQKEIEAAKDTAKQDALKQVETDKVKEEASTQAKAPAKKKTDTTCNADELTLSVATSATGSGAGTIAYDLILKNTGRRTCILGGFPGVSLVNDNGNQIGSPAERATNYTEKTLSLTPNKMVKAVLSTSNPVNFSDGQCKTDATKVRVYPPNDTGYLSVASPVSAWCPGFMISPVLEM